jgi:prepilin-type N-terminal cleavage/methylation domain-containing protein
MTRNDSSHRCACQLASRPSPPGSNLQPAAGNLLPTTDHGLRPAHSASAFTLIELMVVVAIMGVIMAIGIPFAYHTMHKESLTKTVSDVMEVFSHARARAILQGQMTEVVFHPQEGRLEVSGGGASSAAENGAAVAANASLPHGSGLSAEIPKNLTVDMLDVNLTEYKDAETARVRFYPNGTCDECTLVLHSDNNQYRKISLELTTGLADVESDYTKFK